MRRLAKLPRALGPRLLCPRAIAGRGLLDAFALRRHAYCLLDRLEYDVIRARFAVRDSVRCEYSETDVVRIGEIGGIHVAQPGIGARRGSLSPSCSRACVPNTLFPQTAHVPERAWPCLDVPGRAWTCLKLLAYAGDPLS